MLEKIHNVINNGFLGKISPKGVKNKIPHAYPTCVNVLTNPISDSSVLKVLAISTNKG